MAVEEAFLAGFNTAKSMPGLDYCDAATLLRVSELARSTSKRARDEIRRILPACVGVEFGERGVRVFNKGGQGFALCLPLELK
jgi:hypothetical protein